MLYVRERRMKRITQHCLLLIQRRRILWRTNYGTNESSVNGQPLFSVTYLLAEVRTITNEHGIVGIGSPL